MGIKHNTKILIKCFQEGFFSSHKKDVILLSILSVLFISLWALFGIFGILNNLALFVYFINLTAVVIGTLGTAVLSYFLKNIDKLEREFNEKATLRRKLNKILNSLEKEVSSADMFRLQVTKMADNITGLGMWVKSYTNGNYLYTFADKTMREEIFNDLPLQNLIGKSDSYLHNKEICTFELPKNFKEDTIPYINLENQDCAIGDITDEITAKLKKPCRFFEVINENMYDVYKTPLLNKNNEVIGIVGALVNVSALVHPHNTIKEIINTLGAYQIDGTSNYYIKRYSFTTRCDLCVLNKKEIKEE